MANKQIFQLPNSPVLPNPDDLLMMQNAAGQTLNLTISQLLNIIFSTMGLDNFDDVRALTPERRSHNMLVAALGEAAAGDGAGALFYFDAGSTDAEDLTPSTLVLKPSDLSDSDPGRWKQYL